ncbi:MAG: hypothetical protein IPM69_14870 [Ignavibacteria bacterium]|nr:hypothetical protein [Ignavibacteria bacterium]
MAKKFSYNIKANIKVGFGKEALIDDLSALAVPLVYTLLPTVLNVQGWLAMFIGFAVPYAAGKLFNMPGVCHAALAVAGTHLIYAKGQGMITNAFSRPIWTLTPASEFGQPSITQDGTTPAGVPIQGLSGTQYITAGNEKLVTYNPREIEQQAYPVPEPMSTSTIGDFVEDTSVPVSTVQWGRNNNKRRTSKSNW